MSGDPLHSVTVTVPATSANLGPGFDALGLALELRDQVRATVVDGPPGSVTVDVTGEGASTVPRDGGHLVVRAAHRTYAALGVQPPALELRCTNRVPHGRGLGSSAAAAVAGVLLARALAGEPDDRAAALVVATGIEGHPDNAAPCLLGGATIAWTDGDGAHAVRLEPSARLHATLLVPATELSTETARGLLPATVPHADAAHAAGRSALLVEALTRRPELLPAATEDRLHQDYRAPAMPATADLVARLRGAGLAAVVSGAGPSVLVLSDGAPEDTGADVAGLAGPGWDLRDLAVAAAGATVRAVRG